MTITQVMLFVWMSDTPKLTVPIIVYMFALSNSLKVTLLYAETGHEICAFVCVPLLFFYYSEMSVIYSLPGVYLPTWPPVEFLDRRT